MHIKDYIKKKKYKIAALCTFITGLIFSILLLLNDHRFLFLLTILITIVVTFFLMYCSTYDISTGANYKDIRSELSKLGIKISSSSQIDSSLLQLVKAKSDDIDKKIRGLSKQLSALYSNTCSAIDIAMKDFLPRRFCTPDCIRYLAMAIDNRDITSVQEAIDVLNERESQQNELEREQDEINRQKYKDKQARAAGENQCNNCRYGKSIHFGYISGDRSCSYSVQQNNRGNCPSYRPMIKK